MRTGRPLTYDAVSIEKIRELAAAGLRVPEIAKAIGRHKAGVWQLMSRLGIPRQPRNKFPKKEENPSWKGGRYVDGRGYIWIHCPDHPNARGKGYVMEHRLAVEASIGRLLTAKEVVHHKNGVRDDNQLENLELFSKNSDHLRHELTGRVPKWTEDGKRRIRAGIEKSRERTLAKRVG